MRWMKCLVAALSFVALLSLLGLAGCSTGSRQEPERIYSLAEPVAPALTSGGLEGVLMVEPLTAAPVYSGRSMAWRDMASPLEVHVHESYRWSSPPPRLLQEFLLRCLGDGEAADRVVAPDVGVPMDYVLRGHIDRIEVQVDGDRGQAVIELELSLEQRNPRRLMLSRRVVDSGPMSALNAQGAIEAFEKSTQSLCRDVLRLIASAQRPGG